jgi:hypothetical protein
MAFAPIRELEGSGDPNKRSDSMATKKAKKKALKKVKKLEATKPMMEHKSA